MQRGLRLDKRRHRKNSMRKLLSILKHYFSNTYIRSIIPTVKRETCDINYQCHMVLQGLAGFIKGDISYQSERSLLTVAVSIFFQEFLNDN